MNSNDYLDIPEWVRLATPADIQSLRESLDGDVFINDDAIPIRSSYIYIVSVNGRYLPVFKSQFNAIRNEAYDMIRAKLV